MKGFLTKPNHAGSLAYQIHAHVAGMRAGRSLKRIHASDVTKEDWCPRRHALMLATHTGPADEHIGTAQALAFGISSMVADTVVGWVADAGLAIGDWRCVRCNQFYVYCKRPDGCKKCKGKFKDQWRYVEHRFQSDTSGISGGVDLFVRIPGATLDRLVELKALKQEVFKELKMPLAEHRERTNLYLRLVEESDDPNRCLIDTDEATVFYVTKGGYGMRSDLPARWGLPDIPFTPFKEFTIQRDDVQTQSMSKAAEGLWNYMQHPMGQPMPSGICISATNSTAQKCAMSKACFGGDYGPVQ